MTVARDWPRVRAERSFLNCPRCGLSIRPKMSSWSPEHCPRCPGNGGIAVWMFRSRLPTAELYSDDDRAPQFPERRQASQQPAAVARRGVR